VTRPGNRAARWWRYALEHVFVANMTGDVVFLGFAVADAADVSMAGSDPEGVLPQYSLIALLALAMGAQNAAARRLAVPDRTTTVLTLTLTGLAADSTWAGGSSPETWTVGA
jgi:uncharacterized membrane protein YoaK (UPF0700 family)